MNKIISIVIVSFNTIDMTRTCIESIYENMGDLNAEIIVVDNNSKDGSVQMLESEFPDISLIINGDNFGFAAANNQAIKVAKGKYILLLNSDTIILENVLSESISFMENNEDVGAFGCRVLNTDKSVQRTCSQYPSLTNLLLLTSGLSFLKWPEFLGRYQMTNWDRDSERDVEIISGCYLLTRKNILDSVGVLDEDFFFFGEETDWCLRVRKSGWRLVFSPVGEIIHHGGGSVKKLKYKRDIMLTRATVLLHRKHGGILSAVTAFFILFLFNSSRALYWTFCSVVNKSCKDRAAHFRKIFFYTASTWPNRK